MRNILKFIFTIGFIFLNTLFAQTLTMGYRENERLPLIGKIGNNSGLYFDLYSTAAKKMNIELKIVRASKKRIIQLMKEGVIDFYPGFTFTKQRTQFVCYIENGLLGGTDVGISLKSLPLIKDLNELKGKRVLAASGGPNIDLLSHIEGVKLNTVPRLSIEKAIALLRLKRHDFYFYNYDTIRYYLIKNNIKDIKLHPNCCGEEKPMYLGFSKTSKNFKEIKNLDYDSTQTISITNTPTVMSKDSLAYQLSITLKAMKESGEIQKIFNKYYK